jgi:hypothetical protein
VVSSRAFVLSIARIDGPCVRGQVENVAADREPVQVRIGPVVRCLQHIVDRVDGQI